jgi:hypothetical protein
MTASRSILSAHFDECLRGRSGGSTLAAINPRPPILNDPPSTDQRAIPSLAIRCTQTKRNVTHDHLVARKIDGVDRWYFLPGPQKRSNQLNQNSRYITQKPRNRRNRRNASGRCRAFLAVQRSSRPGQEAAHRNHFAGDNRHVSLNLNGSTQRGERREASAAEAGSYNGRFRGFCCRRRLLPPIPAFPLAWSD